MKRVLICVSVIAVTVPIGAVAAELPWIEKYLFPIGVWRGLYHIDNSEYSLNYNPITETSNIDDWDPPDYTPMAELKLDYGFIRKGMFDRTPDHIPFDGNESGANGIPDDTEADYEAVEACSNLGIRPLLVIFKPWHRTMHTRKCNSGECGEQEPDPPLPNPCDQFDKDEIMADYVYELVTNYENNGFSNVFDLYRGLPIAQINIEDEPFKDELLRSKVMIDFYAEHDADMIPMNHIHDRTETNPIDGIDNFYSWAVCHIGEKVLCGRTYHLRRGNLANSPELYNGWEYVDPEHPEDPPIPYGVPALERRLVRARETSLEYDVPFWFLPSAETYNGSGPNAHRSKSPREVRGPVNMALTYGARGIMYYGLYNHQGYDLMDNYGDFWAPNYTLLAYDPSDPEGYIPYTISSQDLYDEILDINTKLHSVRDTLQTTVSLDAFHSFDLANSLPRSLVCDYEGNRTGRQYYQPDYTEETDFLDFGTFVCPYTGVRYFAVSDRFCNWPPATYPDPSEEDEVTVRHPGQVITDIYDTDDSPYNDTYFAVINHDSGVSTFDFKLDNADGRVFKLDPCLNHDPGMERGSEAWDMTGGLGMSVDTDGSTARKGEYSLRVDRLLGSSELVVESRTFVFFIGASPDAAPGATYRLSGYIKCSSGWTGPAYLRLQWTDEDRYPVGVAVEAPAFTAVTDWAGPGRWAYTYVDFKLDDIPPGSAMIRVELVVTGGPAGTVWFDEVRFEPLSRVFNGHFEWDGGDWWPGQAFGWGYSLDSPGQKYWRSSPGYDGDYCLKVGAKDLVNNVVRNDEKLYLSKGTNYKVTGWAKKELGCPPAEVIVEFYTTKGYKFNVESHTVPAGDWQQFTIAIAPNEWSEYDFMPIPVDPGKPAYVRIACKVASGSPTKNAYFDNIELIETNLVYNGSFELAEEGPHHPDRWRYPGPIPTLPPGAPGWSALYDADSKYDRRCWRVRASDQSNINYSSETFVLESNTQYRLSGWLRNFDVELGVNKSEGCKLKINLYDGYGNSLDSYTTGKVTDTEAWTYKYVNFTTPAPTGVKYYGRVTVIEEEDAYSSAADGIRVLPTGILE